MPILRFRSNPDISMCLFDLLGIDRSEPRAKDPTLNIKGVTLNCRVRPTLRSQGVVVGGSRSHSSQDPLDPLTQVCWKSPGDLNCSIWDRDLRGAEKLRSIFLGLCIGGAVRSRNPTTRDLRRGVARSTLSLEMKRKIWYCPKVRNVCTRAASA
jgi:hypothetical protein